MAPGGGLCGECRSAAVGQIWPPSTRQSALRAPLPSCGGAVAPASNHISSGTRVVIVSTRRQQAYRHRSHGQNGFALTKSR